MQYKRLTFIADVKALINQLNANNSYAVLDTETTGLDRHRDRITDVILLDPNNPEQAFIFSADFIDELNYLTVPIVAHNFRFDFVMAYQHGVDLRKCGLLADTMLLHHLVDENTNHGLDEIVQTRYNDPYKEKFWSEFKTFQSAPEERQLEYAGKDVIYTALLYKDLLKDLQAQEIPEALIEHVHNLALTLYDTELLGLKVDTGYLTDLGVELKPKIAELKHAIVDLVPGYVESIEHDLWAKEIKACYTPKGKKWMNLPKPEFNLSASKQIGCLLYDKLKLPEQFQVNKKTKQRSRTVDDKALETLKDLHPVIPLIQDLREKEKVYNAFIEGTIERLHNGRVYPSFNINGTVTGRISSSNPNMQQLPAKGDWAKIRGIYVPDTGYKILSCDYSQLEVVIAAHYSQDKNLLRIINEGVSKHDITAEGVGVPRQVAKTLNFAMQYGCTPKKVMQIANCNEEEAVKIWNKYWETYAGEKAVIDTCAAKVDMGEPIINAFGRRRRFPLKFEKPWQKAAAHRQAYSSLVQGTGADCTNWACYTLDKRLKELDLGRVLFTVHDEIIITAKETHCAQAKDLLVSTMIEAGRVANLTVPLSVECSEPLDRWKK